MRLPRPYIPVGVRCAVAKRQLLREKLHFARLYDETLTALLERRLQALAMCLNCERGDLRLDHDPALENRLLNQRTGKYTPDANDPDFLIYRPEHDHHIKTHVRGDGARRSDTAEAKHWRKVKKNADRRSGKLKVRKRKWAKQKLRSRNTFSQQKSKFQSRRTNRRPQAGSRLRRRFGRSLHASHR